MFSICPAVIVGEFPTEELSHVNQCLGTIRVDEHLNGLDTFGILLCSHDRVAFLFSVKPVLAITRMGPYFFLLIANKLFGPVDKKRKC